jgi:hypothetical protein
VKHGYYGGFSQATFDDDSKKRRNRKRGRPSNSNRARLMVDMCNPGTSKVIYTFKIMHVVRVSFEKCILILVSSAPFLAKLQV